MTDDGEGGRTDPDGPPDSGDGVTGSTDRATDPTDGAVDSADRVADSADGAPGSADGAVDPADGAVDPADGATGSGDEAAGSADRVADSADRIGDPVDPGGAGRHSGVRRAAVDRFRAVARRLDVAPAALAAVVAVVLVGALARFVRLGVRGAHYDEGRVAYWVLRYARSGHFEYRPIIHGPLIQHVDRWLFVALGPTDLVARLPVAVVGALLPLCALLFRDHLRDREVVGLALLLAGNPLLLYYSRFMRSDLLVATFALATLGALLRLLAARRPRYVHAAAVLFALALASKENAAVYAVSWLGAGALVADAALFRPRRHPTGLAWLRRRAASIADGARDRPRAVAREAGRWTAHVAVAVGLFLLATLVLYAPRAGTVGGPGLWKTVAGPGEVPALLAATADALVRGFEYWVGGAGDPGCFEETLPAGYACYLGRMARTLVRFALPVAALSVVGALQDRYATADSRPLVQFAFYWGAASFLGYPLATDIWAAWAAVHVIVPLAIPAAVGLGFVAATARSGLADWRADLDAVAGRGGEGDRNDQDGLDGGRSRDYPDQDDRGGEGSHERPLAAARLARTGLVVVLVVGVLAFQGGVGAYHAYLDHSDRDSRADMVQYAQPSAGIRPAVDAMRTAVAGHDGGPDVLYYGDRFYLADESVADQPRVHDPDSDTGAWYDRLPLPWYTEAAGAEVASVRDADALEAALAGRPPVIVADASRADDVADHVDGYRRFEFDMRAQTGPTRATEAVVFVDERRLDGS